MVKVVPFFSSVLNSIFPFIIIVQYVTNSIPYSQLTNHKGRVIKFG
jgi:hypothetical protein